MSRVGCSSSLFQEATHEVLKIRGVAFGGPLVWLVDFGIQLALVWHATRDPAKLPLAVANTVSPAEPLLQDAGGPVYSAWPLLVVTVHVLEWCTATAVILGVNSRDDLLQIFQDDSALVVASVWCATFVVPVLCVLRCWCAWKSTCRSLPTMESKAMNVLLELDGWEWHSNIRRSGRSGIGHCT